ncbi:hypothetical protein [Chryseobacterium contaminans]|uniref:hypothetical protein n=1 Tax=Chryseobacterium contaminans TaxID=1423959 RepID=UPI00301ACCD0
MLKSYILKNWKVLFNIQWIGFSIFNVLTVIYYWNKTAHIYFNRSLEIINIQSLFSLIMTWLFASFTVVILVYPFLFLMQIYFIRQEKGGVRKLFLLFVLYLLAFISVFSLYTINSSHAIKTITLSL